MDFNLNINSTTVIMNLDRLSMKLEIGYLTKIIGQIPPHWQPTRTGYAVVGASFACAIVAPNAGLSSRSMPCGSVGRYGQKGPARSHNVSSRSEVREKETIENEKNETDNKCIRLDSASRIHVDK